MCSVKSRVNFQDNEFGACNLNKPYGHTCICKDSPCKIMFPDKTFFCLWPMITFPEYFFQGAITQTSPFLCFHVTPGALT